VVARQREEMLDAMLFKRANDNVGTSQYLCHLWSNSSLLMAKAASSIIYGFGKSVAVPPSGAW
jgi:hypothetical protein